MGVGGRRERSEVDGVRQPRVLRAPQHAGRGARARARARQRAGAPARAAAGKASSRLDSSLRQRHCESHIHFMGLCMLVKI